ncbi:hypothetical protein ANN_24957 [Periplaneta americana]|uniref:Uncharacterized protein n=1 Tax=Periplaneta americana TaxID=6978 RepID=A0ABQ8S091_PERAM|nr:hypothetical protein ANN_24957 [Periplaneta americana]
MLSDNLMQQGSRYLRKMAAQLRNREATVLHNALPHQLNTIIIDEGRSPTALFIMDTLTTFGKLPTPATHHSITHDVRPIDLTELPMNFNWRNALCIKELYHRPNLAGGGRRNELPFRATAATLLAPGEKIGKLTLWMRLVLYSQSILNRWKNYFGQLLNGHRPNRNDRDEIQIQTAEPFIPESTLSDVEITIENLKKYKSPGYGERVKTITYVFVDNNFDGQHGHGAFDLCCGMLRYATDDNKYPAYDLPAQNTVRKILVAHRSYRSPSIATTFKLYSTRSQFKVCHGLLYVVMWLEFNLPTLPQRRITYVPEKFPGKYGVHSESWKRNILKKAKIKGTEHVTYSGEVAERRTGEDCSSICVKSELSLFRVTAALRLAQACQMMPTGASARFRVQESLSALQRKGKRQSKEVVYAAWSSYIQGWPALIQ